MKCRISSSIVIGEERSRIHSDRMTYSWWPIERKTFHTAVADPEGVAGPAGCGVAGLLGCGGCNPP